jgi:hypothetical protein
LRNYGESPSGVDGNRKEQKQPKRLQDAIAELTKAVGPVVAKIEDENWKTEAIGRCAEEDCCGNSGPVA